MSVDIEAHYSTFNNLWHEFYLIKLYPIARLDVSQKELLEEV